MIPEKRMPEPLEQEIQTFENNRARLETEHRGKYVLIKGDKVINTFDDFQTASVEGLRLFNHTPFLIRKIGEEPATLSPVIALGLTGVDLQSAVLSYTSEPTAP